MSEQEMTVEDQAKMVGWNEGGAKSAEEFLEVREGHLGAARADIKKLETGILSLQASNKAMAQHMEKRERLAIEQGYTNAVNDAKNAMRTAADEGDTTAYDTAQRRVDHLETEKETKLAEVESIVTEESNDYAEVVKQHMSNNPALFSSKVQYDAWLGEMQFQGNRGMSFQDSMAAADQAIIGQFNLGQTMPGPGGDTQQDAGDVSSFASLPQDAKDAYNSIVKENPDYTKETYLEVYNG